MAIFCSQMKSQSGRAPQAVFTASMKKPTRSLDRCLFCELEAKSSFLENMALLQMIVTPNVKFKLVIYIDGLALVHLEHSCGKHVLLQP